MGEIEEKVDADSTPSEQPQSLRDSWQDSEKGIEEDSQAAFLILAFMVRGYEEEYWSAPCIIIPCPSPQ